MPLIPQKHAFGQSEYFDQMTTALPGSRVFASDNHLTDAYIVAPTVDGDGLIAGIGVVANKSADFVRPGINQMQAALPTDASTADDFEGVVYRTQQMGTNLKGQACAMAGDMCNVMRSARVGGRIWAFLADGTVDIGGAVYWIIKDTTSHGKPIGSFAGSNMGGDAIELPNVRFIATVGVAATNDYTIGAIEMGLVKA